MSDFPTSLACVMQARDDSIAGFQMLQQQGPSPGQKERLAHLARQLEDTQAQLLATQVSGTQVTSVLPHLCMQIVHWMVSLQTHVFVQDRAQLGPSL